jgi:hypothetical protein
MGYASPAGAVTRFNLVPPLSMMTSRFTFLATLRSGDDVADFEHLIAPKHPTPHPIHLTRTQFAVGRPLDDDGQVTLQSAQASDRANLRVI